MPNRKRQGNRPDRRIEPNDVLDEATRDLLLARVIYVGSGHHKLRPGNYGFVPSHNPRPSKSTCDDLRSMSLDEATELFQEGIRLGMISRMPTGGVPKYVWAMDEAGEVYEAKTKPEREFEYHGYRLGDDDRHMRKYVSKEWRRRCR